MCTVLLPPGGYPIAVKYIKSYHMSLIINFIIPITKHIRDLVSNPASPVTVPSLPYRHENYAETGAES
jgi:hypothetical protein